MSGDDWKAEVFALRDEGLSVRQIADRIGRSKSSVGEVLKPHYCECGNVKGHGKKQCRPCLDAEFAADREAFGDLWQEGLTIKQIADRTGLSTGSVAVKLNRIRDRYDREDLVPYRYSEQRRAKAAANRWGKAA
jgi:DNA-directed RNA polymerase specialized sigma24 family protein